MYNAGISLPVALEQPNLTRTPKVQVLLRLRLIYLSHLERKALYFFIQGFLI